jgi:hypothetical protein
MSNEWLATINLGAWLTYAATAIALYLIVIRKQDVVIQQKDERIAFLKDQLDIAKTQTPDELLKALKERLTAALEEIERLRADASAANARLLAEKVARLDSLKKDIEAATRLTSVGFGTSYGSSAAIGMSLTNSQPPTR